MSPTSPVANTQYNMSVNYMTLYYSSSLFSLKKTLHCIPVEMKLTDELGEERFLWREGRTSATLSLVRSEEKRSTYWYTDRSRGSDEGKSLFELLIV